MSWSAMRSLLRTGFCAEAAAVPPPPPPLLTPLPLLLWVQAGAETAAAAEVGLKPAPGVGDGEEEADDVGELGTGAEGELGPRARDDALGRLWSFAVPLGRGGSS